MLTITRVVFDVGLHGIFECAIPSDIFLSEQKLGFSKQDSKSFGMDRSNTTILSRV